MIMNGFTRIPCVSWRRLRLRSLPTEITKPSQRKQSKWPHKVLDVMWLHLIWFPVWTQYSLPGSDLSSFVLLLVETELICWGCLSVCLSVCVNPRVFVTAAQRTRRRKTRTKPKRRLHLSPHQKRRRRPPRRDRDWRKSLQRSSWPASSLAWTSTRPRCWWNHTLMLYPFTSFSPVIIIAH